MFISLFMDNNKGMIAGVSAYVFWGIAPVFWKALNGVDALYMLFSRIFWSFIFLLLYFMLSGKMVKLKDKLNKSNLVTTFASGLLISLNWGIFIYAIFIDRVTEASLGYFINPLFFVFLGILFLKEQVNIRQKSAIIIAAIGVFYLIFVYGKVPWIALCLISTFSVYGLIKKKCKLQSVESLFMETVWMVIPAIIFLIHSELTGKGVFLESNTINKILVSLSGPVTAVPLLLFAVSAKRITLINVGFLQYIAPVLQFLLGVLIYKEDFPLTKAIGYSIIWFAIVVYITGLRKPLKKINN